jgi:hypothetical protein
MSYWTWLFPLLLAAATIDECGSLMLHRLTTRRGHAGRPCASHPEQQQPEQNQIISLYEQQRQSVAGSLAKLFVASGLSLGSAGSAAARTDGELGNVADLVLPLDSFEDVYTVNYTVNGVVFRAIVDTGSPFIIIPSVCTKQWGGCSSTGHFDLERCNLEPTTGTEKEKEL